MGVKIPYVWSPGKFPGGGVILPPWPTGSRAREGRDTYAEGPSAERLRASRSCCTTALTMTASTWSVDLLSSVAYNSSDTRTKSVHIHVHTQHLWALSSANSTHQGYVHINTSSSSLRVRVSVYALSVFRTSFIRTSGAFTVTRTSKQGRRSLWDRGDTSPQYLDWGGHDPECPPNISRVISATFYPCNIFLISWKSF